jgi:pimeloyl-ACP methyl ester carboxylesterase
MRKSIGLICFAIVLLGLWPVSVRAEISYPYFVDQRTQVLLGDSTPITINSGNATTTYYGFENYKQDYVNGYAHLTFSYTHHKCCYASYPPMVYMTPGDPRVNWYYQQDRWLAPAYHLAFMFAGMGDDTGLYFYDIQFDATGYRVVVKLAEEDGSTSVYKDVYTTVPDQVDTDWVALANWHPYFNGGSLNSMAFTPVPIKEGSQELDPVIIIPGIMGSAKKNGQLVLDPILHTYDDLVDTLLANGYEENVTLFKFPYEWRDSNVHTADLLDDKIDQVKQICNCNKVDLVAHSMGGLVARAYIQSADYDQDVDQMIFLGTPHKGAPTTYLKWEAGEISPDISTVLEDLFFRAEAIKNGYSNIFNYIQNRPILSVKELLPIFDYLKDAESGVIRNYPNSYPQNNFLENLNSNISILLNSGIKISNIIGDSEENKTLEIIRVVTSTRPGLWEHGQPENYYAGIGDHGLDEGAGDNTVPIKSASADNQIPYEKINASHSRIPTVAAGKIYTTLTNKTATTIIDRGFQLSPRVLILQLLSPIDVVVTAPDGKKVGKNFSGGEFNEIPDAFYSGNSTDEEYVTILNPLDGEYKIEVKGTGSGGGYGVLTSYASDEFATTTQINGTTLANQITQISVEVDNDAPEDLEADRVVTAEVLLNDIKQAYQLGWIKDKKLYDKLYRQACVMLRIDSQPLRLWWKLPIDKRAARVLANQLGTYNANQITEQAYNLIKADLEYLINNN